MTEDKFRQWIVILLALFLITFWVKMITVSCRYSAGRMDRSKAALAAKKLSLKRQNPALPQRTTKKPQALPKPAEQAK